MQITEHFSLEEVVFSATATRLKINNTPPVEIVKAIYNTANQLEKVRISLGSAIHINSWYRCLALNALLGSKPTSQHPKGEAVDFTCPNFGSPLDICRKLIQEKDTIQFDQLILEHTWVHISWNSDPATKQKGQVLSLLNTGGYASGLTTNLGEAL